MQSYRQPFLGDPLGVFNIRSVAKLQKIEERTLPGKIVAEKSRIPEKTERGTLRSRPVLYVTRETFLAQFLGPTGTIWRLLKICRTFGVELFWSLLVYQKKH